MSMNAYEIRYNLLNDARAMLTDQWHTACDHVRTRMEISDVKGLEFPAAPTFEEIKKLATNMYEFVQTKS